MKDDERWKNRVAGYFRQLKQDHADEIADLLHWLFEKVSGTSQNYASSCDTRFAKHLDSLNRGRFGEISSDLLTEDFFKETLHLTDQPLNMSTIGTDGENLSNNPAIFHFLYNFGVLTPPDNGGTSYLGYSTYSKWKRRVTTTLTEAFSNLSPAFWPHPYRKLYLDEIPTANKAKPAIQNLEHPPVLTPEQTIAHSRGLLKWYEDVISHVDNQCNIPFKKLLRPVDFYNRASEMYAKISSESSRSLATFVFSTTSGLAVKEQYLGSNQFKTSQYRQPYFDTLRACKGKIYYQLDPQSTWTSKKGIQHSTLPLEEHIKHFASFLTIPNLEISEENFNTPETKWRQLYTLIASDDRVAYSTREQHIKQISNGIIATRAYWRACGQNKHPYDVVERLYQSQTSAKQIIKKMGESLSKQEAIFRARETFDRWKKTFSL